MESIEYQSLTLAEALVLAMEGEKVTVEGIWVGGDHEVDCQELVRAWIEKGVVQGGGSELGNWGQKGFMLRK